MIAAIVLAAGRSRRMGTQKLLLPLGDKPIITRIVDEVLRSQIDRVFVVIGPDGNGISEALIGRKVVFVTNPDPEAEMLSSIRCGLRAIPDNCDAVMVFLGDQPSISTCLIALLVQDFQTSDHGIIVPTYNGRRGHPILFAMHYLDEILTQYQDVGLRGLLQAHPEDVFEVIVASPIVIEDMDLPEDYERETKRHNKGC